MSIDEKCIRRCLKLAEYSQNNGDYYFGALITYDDKIIVEAKNTVQQDITGHAEINAIKKLRDQFPDIDPADCTLYSSLEPCGMCSFLIRDIGIGRVVFSAPSPYMGGYSKWDILTTTDLQSGFTLSGRTEPPTVTPFILKDKSVKILDDLKWQMHKCPNLTQNEVKEIITKMASDMSVSTKNAVTETFDSYNKVESENRHVSYLRDRIKAKYPNLFDKSTGKVKLSDYTKFVNNTKESNGLVSIKDSQTMHTELSSLKKQMLSLFSKKQFTHSSRISSTKQIAKKLRRNGVRGTLDSIGYRLVPKNAADFSDMVSKFEIAFAGQIKYKLNTFALDDDEFYSILSKSSSLSYRAIHYYITIGDCIAEVQLRTSSTDIWASIHHETMYKPKREVTTPEKQAIDKFGIIANIVDYNKILGIIS